MSAALQIALFVATVAIALFVLVLIPLSILLYRRATVFSRQLEELNMELKGLVQDSRTMVQNITAATIRVNGQLDELESIVGVIRRWSERANHVVDEVGTTFEASFRKANQSTRSIFQAWGFIMRLAGEMPWRTNHKDGANEETHK